MKGATVSVGDGLHGNNLRNRDVFWVAKISRFFGGVVSGLGMIFVCSFFLFFLF